MIDVYKSIIEILEEQPLKNAVPGESCIRITATTMERKNNYHSNSMYLSLTQAQVDGIVEVAGDMIIDNMTGAPLVQERAVHKN